MNKIEPIDAERILDELIGFANHESFSDVAEEGRQLLDAILALQKAVPRMMKAHAAYALAPPGSHEWRDADMEMREANRAYAESLLRLGVDIR